MVIAAGEAEEDRQRKFPTTSMAIVPERSRTLHNFSSLPCFNVKWGRQKQLRCVKSAATAADRCYPTSSDSSQNHNQRRPGGDFRSTPDRKRRSGEDVGGIEAMREKLMLDFRSEIHQMRAAFLGGGGQERGGEGVGVAAEVVAEVRPWNLRTRRAVCKEPNNGNGDQRLSFSPARQSEWKSPPMRCGDVDGGQKGPRAKFSGSLSKREIEEDFLAIQGTRPARRPKKRPKNVQKQVDALFPGYWLTEITADMYKVNENPESGKR